MLKISVTLFSIFALTACLQSGGPAPVSDVVRQCDSKDFRIFNNCIQLNYSGPKSLKISSFFAELDAIEEDLNYEKISNVRAKSLAYAAYENTVGKADIFVQSAQHRDASKGADALAAWAIDYGKREQERADEFNASQRNKRTTTSCSKFGSTITCNTR